MSASRSAWLLIGGQSIAIVGESVLLMVLPLMVLDLTGSAFQVGIVFILTQAPYFFSFLSGYFRQKFPSKQLIIYYDLLRFLLLIGIAGLVWIEVYPILLVYAFIFFINLCSTLFRPTRIEFITHIVSPESLTKFNSIDRTFEAIAMAIGLGLGGYAYYYLKLEHVFALSSLTFLLATILVLFLRVAPSGQEVGEKEGERVSFWSTFLSVNQHPKLFFLVYGETLASVAFGCFMTMFIIFSRQILEITSITLGHLQMVQALFAIVAGLIVAYGLLKISERFMALAGYSGMAVPFLVMGLTDQLWLLFIFVACVGFFNMLYSISVRTLLQTNSRKEEMIHVFSLETLLSRLAYIIGAAVASGMADLFQVPANWLIAIAGFLLIIVSLWGYKILFLKDNQISERGITG